MNTINTDFAAFKAKLLSSSSYEKRAEPDLASTIESMVTGLAEFKQGQAKTVSELRGTVERLEAKLARPGAFTSTRQDTDGGAMPASLEQRTALNQLLRTGDRSYAIEARAAVNAGTAGQGLEAVAPWFDSEVLKLARANAPLLSVIRRKVVTNFPAKHIVGNGNVMGSGWASEQMTRGDTDAPLPMVVTVAAGEWWALPAVTEWALADVNFDVLGWLQGELAAEYSETMMAAVVGGSGVDKPKGFLAGPTPVTTLDGSRAFGTLQYFPTGQAGTLPTTTSGVLDLLMDVVHGTRWSHRQNASWVMSALTMSTLRKFKDADGRPILLDSLISGQPAKLLGYPLVECELMPSIGANAFPIAFGDFSEGYVLDEDSGGMRITRDEITQKGFVKFYARRRVGGAVLNSEAIKLVKVSAA